MKSSLSNPHTGREDSDSRMEIAGGWSISLFKIRASDTPLEQKFQRKLFFLLCSKGILFYFNVMFKVN